MNQMGISRLLPTPIRFDVPRHVFAEATLHSQVTAGIISYGARLVLVRRLSLIITIVYHPVAGEPQVKRQAMQNMYYVTVTGIRHKYTEEYSRRNFTLSSSTESYSKI